MAESHVGCTPKATMVENLTAAPPSRLANEASARQEMGLTFRPSR
jgi:hypothetical protein